MAADGPVVLPVTYERVEDSGGIPSLPLPKDIPHEDTVPVLPTLRRAPSGDGFGGYGVAAGMPTLGQTDQKVEGEGANGLRLPSWDLKVEQPEDVADILAGTRKPGKLRTGPKSREEEEFGITEPLGPVQDIVSHTYDMKVEDDFLGRGKTEIHMWTLSRDEKDPNKSTPNLLRIQDFPVFCHMELPQFVDGRVIDWTEGSAGRVVEWLARTLGEDAPTKWIFTMKPKIYYYREDRKFPMVMMMFKTVKAMYHCQNLVAKPRRINDLGNIKLEMLETSISIIRKLFSLRGCRYAQWFTIKGQEVPIDHEARVSTEGTPSMPEVKSGDGKVIYPFTPAIPLREYIVEWKTLEALPPEATAGWTTNPRILAFDIETYSDNHRAMPNEFNVKHVAYMISCVYQRLGDPGSRRRYAIIVGDCNEISGAEVIRCKNEVGMVAAMAKLVRDLDPEIVSGYNIFGYDNRYLDVRLKTKMQDWPMMGRIQGRIPIMTTKSWASSAYGHNNISMLSMEGRITIDMLPIVRRDFKLDKYDLDTVSKNFLKKGKHDIKAPHMFGIFERLEKAIANLEAVQKGGGKAKAIKEAIDEARRAEAAKAEAIKALQLRVDTAQANLDEAVVEGDHAVMRAAEEELVAAKAEMTRVMEYCIQDAELVIELFEKLNVWIGLVELSSIVGVTITDLFTRGQQIRCQSQIYNLASNLGYVLDKMTLPKGFFNGGLVFEPIPGVYDRIICFDFASLYPSIMEAFNISHETLVPDELYDQVPDEMCNIIEFDQEEPADGKARTRRGASADEEGSIEGVNDEEQPDDEEDGEEKTGKAKTVKRHYRFKWIKASVRMGVLPTLVRNLVAERNAVKKQMKVIEGHIKSPDKLVDLLKTTSIEAIREQCAKEQVDLATRMTSTDKAVAKAAKERFDQINLWLTTAVGDTTAECMKQCAAKIFIYKLTLVVLDKRQGALKVSANSMFGFLGAQNGGLMPLLPGAMCICAIGRQLITAVNEYVKTKYNAKIVYNDTDSAMVDIPECKEAKDCDYWGNRLALEINGRAEEKLDDGTIIPAVKGLFPPPLRVEFEKSMRLCLFKKKKYAYYLIAKNGDYIRDKDTGLPELGKKGIILARRDNCLTGDTLVTMANGMSRRIDHLTEASTLYGWDGTGLSTAQQTAFGHMGKKACIKLTAWDGRTITCTPDHRLLVLTVKGEREWKEAGKIDLTADRLVCGMEATEDIVGDDEKDWQLDVGECTFTLIPERRDQTLAFVRLLGYMNADGNLSQREDGRIDCSLALGHMLDAEAVIRDIQLICGDTPVVTARTTAISSFYQIRIPNLISELFLQLEGQTTSRRSDSIVLTWPKFLMDDKCPRAVLREFVGGVLGGDGHAPYLTKVNTKDPHHLLQGVLLGMSTKPEHGAAMKSKMEAFCGMLTRIGFVGAYVRENPEIYSVVKGDKSPENLRAMYRVCQPGNSTNYLKKIGFRYCVHKQMRLTIASSLWRYYETIRAERKATLVLAAKLLTQPKVTRSTALKQAKEWMLANANPLYPNAITAIGQSMFDSHRSGTLGIDTTLTRYVAMQPTREWLINTGSLEAFEVETGTAYAVKRGSSTPVFYLPLRFRVDAGEHDVYDISVDKLESFSANGIVTHNCKFLRDTYLPILRNIMDKDPFEVAFGNLTTAVCRLLRNEVPAKGNLTIIRELGANYKNSNYFMARFAEELRRMGKPVNPGDRLEYVIVKTADEVRGADVPLGMKMRAIEMWEQAQDDARIKTATKVDVLTAAFSTSPPTSGKKSRLEVVNSSPPRLPLPSEAPTLPGVPSPGKSDAYQPEDIDALYYIEHILMNAIDQLFEVGYSTFLPKYEEVGYKPQHSRCHFGSIKTPVKMMGKMITDLMRGYAAYGNPEKEKLAHIANAHITALPEWFAGRKQTIDVRLAAQAAAVAALAPPTPVLTRKPSRLQVVA